MCYFMDFCLLWFAFCLLFAHSREMQRSRILFYTAVYVSAVASVTILEEGLNVGQSRLVGGDIRFKLTNLRCVQTK